MKNAIIMRSIEELLQNGLRFSIDEVAKSLKISKKTIYKLFSTKEQLAVEIYKTYYENALSKIQIIQITHPHDAAAQMLTIYFQSHCMVKDDIFNKYALNENIRVLAQKNHRYIKTLIENSLPQEDRAALMIIIDGAMKNLCESNIEKEKVIERLVYLYGN